MIIPSVDIFMYYKEGHYSWSDIRDQVNKQLELTEILKKSS
jgi:hypothetical protein